MKKDCRADCLRGWAEATISNLIEMEKNGADKAHKSAYLELSMQAGNLLDTVLTRSGNVDAIVDCLAKDEKHRIVIPNDKNGLKGL